MQGIYRSGSVTTVHIPYGDRVREKLLNEKSFILYTNVLYSTDLLRPGRRGGAGVPLPGRAGKEREDAGGREQIAAIAASPRVWMRRFTLCIVLYFEVCVCVCVLSCIYTRMDVDMQEEKGTWIGTP